MAGNTMDAMRQAMAHVRSADWQRVRGAYGQLALWPERYVDEGWDRRDTIRMFPDCFMREPDADE